jgi:Sec-independent protein translocase protein TatA
MFGIGLSEFFVIAFVIILFIKPKDIPKVFRFLGKIAGKAKAAYNEVLEIKDQIVKEIDDAAEFNEKEKSENTADLPADARAEEKE